MIPTIMYVTSSAAQIRGIKLRNTKIELKKNVFSFSIQALFDVGLYEISFWWDFILESPKYTKKDKKARASMTVEPITANHW